jgi:hypothetical protein
MSSKPAGDFRPIGAAQDDEKAAGIRRLSLELFDPPKTRFR